MNIKYGISVIDITKINVNESYDVIHFVGYETEPTHLDYLSLYEEFRTDETLHMVDMIDNIRLIPSTQDMIEHMIENTSKSITNLYNDVKI